MPDGSAGRHGRSCSSIWNDVPGFARKRTIRAPARANASREGCRAWAAARDAARPAGDIVLAHRAKIRWVNQKNNQRERHDEGFGEQARRLCCSALSVMVARGRAAGVRPELSVAQHHGDHSVRAGQRQRHHRAHRARAGRQADRASPSSSTTAAAPAAPSASARRRAPRRTATPSCSIRRRSAPPM